MFIYLLESVNFKKYYVGKTSDLEERIKRHNAGYEKATGPYIPYKLISFIEVDNDSDATRLERMIKAKKKKSAIYKYFEENGMGSSPAIHWD